MTLRALLGAAPDWVDGTIPGAFQTMYLERRSDYRLTAEERQAKLARVGQDGAWLLDALASEAGAALRGLAAVCAACPLRPQCTTGRGGRNLSLSEHYERLVARRAEARTPAFRAKLTTRAGIEATLSELVRAHGLRRHRYRGDAKRHFEHLLKAAACNVKRLARALVARQQAPHPRLALTAALP